MAAGKLIVIEGADGSGKATQAALLCERLAAQGVAARQVSFPDYASEGSAAARFYLSGQLGREANVYAAAVAFAFDRYASFVNGWSEDYRHGSVIVADRYVESNFVHQGVKLPDSERVDFMAWLDDFEYVRLGLPRPNAVIYLRVPTSVSEELLRQRHRAADIHEADADYLRRCHQRYDEVARELRWRVIECAANGRMRDALAIADDVDRLADQIINVRSV